MHPQNIGDASQLRHRVEAQETDEHNYCLQSHEQPEGHNVQETSEHEPGHQLGYAGQGRDPRRDEGVIICK